MIRLALFSALVFSVSASAQTEMPADTVDVMVADSTAADSTETAIQPDPDRARELYREGLEMYRSSDFENALLKYEEALLYEEAYAPAGLGRAQVLTRLNRLEDARSAFESAVAMSRGFEAANADQLQGAAENGLQQVIDALDARTAAAEQNQAAEALTTQVNSATEMLSGNEISEDQATQSLAIMDRLVADGYDADNLAFYYAKAYNALGRGAEAVPFAETALAASEGDADRSGFYIQLGLAHMSAGNADQARAAFEAISEGQSWHGWAQHYIRELDA